MLAHGLFGFRRIGLGKLTLASYFREIPEALRAAGNRVVVTKVPSIASVAVRAQVLAAEIERAFPGEPVHIIGHSMGGLDARELLADPAWANRVRSLTTLGTPHLGSALADLARMRVGRVYRLLKLLGVEYGGFLDVTRAARAVNRHGRPPSGVVCLSIAGDPAPDDVSWTLRPFHEILNEREGPNDGLVSVESALAFGTPLPIWPVDHFRMMNWHSPPRGPSTRAAVLRLYGDLLAHLVDLGLGSTMPAEEPFEHASEHHRRRFLVSALPQRFRGGGAIEEHGDCHVAENVRRGPAAIEKPVDRQ